MASMAWGQLYPVSAEQWGERIIVITELQGDGKPGNPRRPRFVPAPPTAEQARAAALEGQRLREEMRDAKVDRVALEVAKKHIYAASWVLGDDGKTVILELVAAHRDAFAEIFKEKSVRVFDKRELFHGEAGKAAAREELRRVKKDFEWEELQAGAK